MRRRGLLIVAACAALTAPAAAQDTLNDPVRAERLRQQIEMRFGERLREELGLSDEQSIKLRVALSGLATKRRLMEQEERRMRQALAYQLRPGVAANADSTAKLVDGLTNHRVAYAQTFKDEMRELSTILNPVQRGQYLLMRDRLMQRVQDLQQGRQDAPAGPFRPNRRP